MMSVQYYFDLINLIESRKMQTSISLTTNLWGFYKNPEQWSELFLHPRIGVATSFNYGETRRITTDRVFTEDIFWSVSDLFLEKIGYRPDFISVITEENEATAIDNVRLAQKMGVECKLNYAMASGAQGKPYLLSKIYKTYLQVYKLGLMQWEFNTKQLISRMLSVATVCPQNRDCDSSIRCLQPDGDYYSCGAFGDDQEYAINFADEMASTSLVRVLSASSELLSLKQECLTCPMFEICNGCRKTIQDLKRHDMVEEHCTLMKRIAPEILELRTNGRIISDAIIASEHGG